MQASIKRNDFLGRDDLITVIEENHYFDFQSFDHAIEINLFKRSYFNFNIIKFSTKVRRRYRTTLYSTNTSFRVRQTDTP